MRAQLQRLLTRGATAVPPRHSWSVFHPSVRPQVLHPVGKLALTKPPHLQLVQAHVHPSKLEEALTRWGLAFAAGSALYQFVTNLHSVPITGRTQVVAISQDEEVEMGVTAAKDGLKDAKIITIGPRFRMCVDVVSRLVGVSEHLFPREYDWRIWLVDEPSVANACCYPGGKIIIYTGILDVIDAAVANGLLPNKHDALAVILAHEIAHALARHAGERMSYLPILYLQTIIGYESPLLQYVFQFAMNLPFSRVQEMEADHIGIMLMAQACYDPRVAPKFWRVFGSALAAAEGDDGCELAIELDFFSTHPSHKKRERRLETLVADALALQRRASWCFEVKERVQQLLSGDNAFVRRVQSVRQHVTPPPTLPRRRNTVGTVHELENEEILRGLRRQRGATLASTAASTALATATEEPPVPAPMARD